MTGRGEIGRLFSTRSLFPFLKMGTIFASFSCSGKMPSRKDLLNNMVRDGAIWSAVSVSDHVIQQIFAARHFFRRVETREYSTHFQERKKRPCGELSPYLPSPCHLQSSPALRSGGSTGSHIPPLQPQTAWLFSRLITVGDDVFRISPG